jgi:hypothetical protein
MLSSVGLLRSLRTDTGRFARSWERFDVHVPGHRSLRQSRPVGIFRPLSAPTDTSFAPVRCGRKGTSNRRMTMPRVYDHDYTGSASGCLEAWKSRYGCSVAPCHHRVTCEVVVDGVPGRPIQPQRDQRRSRRPWGLMPSFPRKDHPFPVPGVHSPSVHGLVQTLVRYPVVRTALRPS